MSPCLLFFHILHIGVAPEAHPFHIGVAPEAHPFHIGVAPEAHPFHIGVAPEAHPVHIGVALEAHPFHIGVAAEVQKVPCLPGAAEAPEALLVWCIFGAARLVAVTDIMEQLFEMRARLSRQFRDTHGLAVGYIEVKNMVFQVIKGFSFVITIALCGAHT